VVDFLLVLIEIFSPALIRLMRYESILVEIVLFERGWVTLSANFRRKGVVHQRILASKLDSLGYHDVVCVILRLPLFIQYRRVTHRQTDGHTMMAITRASLAPRG